MKRTLTLREKVLILILAIVLLLLGYVKLFLTPITERQVEALQQLTQLQEEGEGEQRKLKEMKEMERTLVEIRQRASYQFSEIPNYDNIDNVMVQLDGILASARSYQLTFSKIDSGELLVSRPINMAFVAANYQAAKKILPDLYQSPYRCALSEITVFSSANSADQGNIVSQQVSVSLTVTFYEKYKDEEAKEAAARAAESRL